MTTFHGWLRTPTRAWHVACRAASYRACWMQLMDVKPGTATAEKYVNTGKHPDERRRPR